VYVDPRALPFMLTHSCRSVLSDVEGGLGNVQRAGEAG